MKARPRSLPLAAKVPLLVAALMVLLGAVASERVLARLSAMQERHLRDLAGVYLDGLSVAILPAALRDDVWESYDILDRATENGGGLRARVTTLVTRDGLVLASSAPLRFVTGSTPDRDLDRIPTSEALTLTGDAPVVEVRTPLLHGEQTVGQLVAELDVAAFLAERRSARSLLLAGNALATVLLSVLGFLVTRRMLRPIAVLSSHMGRDAGPALIAPAMLPPPANEFGRLFRQYNALVRSEREREADARRLAEQERLASLGRLASSVAHEINNPLGGLLNALDTLKRYGHRQGVGERSVALIERGLLGIRDVVSAMIETHRPRASNARLTQDDIEDLHLLIAGEIRRRGQRLDWAVDPAASRSFGLDSGPVRQALLNLLLNASAAAGDGGEVGFALGEVDGRLVARIANTGSALPEEARRLLETGEGTAPGGGVGLRVVSEMVRSLGGRITVENAGTSTAITVALPLSEPREEAA